MADYHWINLTKCFINSAVTKPLPPKWLLKLYRLQLSLCSLLWETLSNLTTPSPQLSTEKLHFHTLPYMAHQKMTGGATIRQPALCIRWNILPSKLSRTKTVSSSALVMCSKPVSENRTCPLKYCKKKIVSLKWLLNTCWKNSTMKTSYLPAFVIAMQTSSYCKGYLLIQLLHNFSP